ncbi:hypothetical protein B1B04_22325 [Lysinibacillus sp. KCTC 33748]|uniref:hypothetical protein n=1 Tax=unclassified Lysinibacillus TaxID=2636778 RepID=UPI0009A87C6F|nr:MULTISPECIES: hypothetical protein [unclassified Lysinibacillus]OXS67531.1 hypothetical protein B1B04_22325 [Lysinibacillus sp. KCTC 33748]SKC14470.1 hypothetical protein SAMN06295926_12831 [Lysinibacillus sp. AC-3]
MKLTPKLNLKKPDLTDNVNIQDLNDNMVVLENAISELQEGATTIPDLETNDKTLAGAINELKDEVTNVETNAKEYTDQQAEVIDTALKVHESSLHHTTWVSGGGTINTLVVVSDSVPMDTANKKPKQGAGLRVFSNFTNSGNMTLAIKTKDYTTAAFPILRLNGAQVASGQIASGSIFSVAFNGSAFILQGEGGGYYKDDLIKVKDLVNRDYIQTSVRENISTYHRWDSTQVATVNGIELGFAYRGSTRDTWLYCWETRTGLPRYVKSVKYEYMGSLLVIGDKLYACYRDYDGVLTGGIGIETMDAMTGSRVNSDRVPSITGFENVRNTCVQVLGGNAYILVGAGSSNYEYLARFDSNGKYVTVSSNYYQYLYTNDYPYWITTVEDQIYVGSFTAVYWFSFGFVYSGKTSVQPAYSYGGLAPNNTGGLAVLTSGAIVQYTRSLSVVTTVTVPYNGTGLGFKGDYFAFYTDTGATLQKMSADGKIAIPEASQVWSAGFKTNSPAKCLGFSENAFVLGSYDTFNVVPTVVTRTLKVIR